MQKRDEWRSWNGTMIHDFCESGASFVFVQPGAMMSFGGPFLPQDIGASGGVHTQVRLKRRL